MMNCQISHSDYENRPRKEAEICLGVRDRADLIVWTCKASCTKVEMIEKQINDGTPGKTDTKVFKKLVNIE